VKGFAITLIIGIAASMISAIFRREDAVSSYWRTGGPTWDLEQSDD